jgi:hypothetical protein
MKILMLGINLFCVVFMSPAWFKVPPAIQKQSSKPTIVYNDEFVMRVMDVDISYNKIMKAYHPKNVIRKIVQNKYQANIKDTLISFSENGNLFSFYKGKEKALLQNMNLSSQGTVLDKNIYIGCDKSLFKNKYKSSLKSYTIIIEDIEGGNVFTFLFKNNKLIQVKYKIEYME